MEATRTRTGSRSIRSFENRPDWIEISIPANRPPSDCWPRNISASTARDANSKNATLDRQLIHRGRVQTKFRPEQQQNLVAFSSQFRVWTFWRETNQIVPRLCTCCWSRHCGPLDRFTFIHSGQLQFSSVAHQCHKQLISSAHIRSSFTVQSKRQCSAQSFV